MDEPFSLGRVFRPEAIEDEAIAAMVTILDEQDLMPSVERLRRWGLEKAGLRAGQRAVDVGSGTGTMTRWLAGEVGSDGEAIGVEPNVALRGVAEGRAVGTSARFVDGTAAAIPLPDASVDVVWCERVLQHLPDPASAIAETARVLRPGGRAIILDSDHESRINSDIDPEVSHQMTLAFMGQLANARSARRIPRLVAEAGLELDPDIGSSAVVFTQAALAASPMLRMSAAQAVTDGRISQEQADEAIRSITAATQHGWAFSTITVFGFCCGKR